MRSISSATMAGSVSIGAGARAGRRPARRPSSGSAGRKSPRSTTVCSASRDQRIGPPETSEEAGAARRRGEALGDVDEQPPAGHVHRPGGGQLPHGEPQGLQGVGHHLLVADRDVDVVLAVVGRRDGEQRGDRPALDDWKSSSTRHHSMSWGRPKCASIRRPSCASRRTCASVSAGSVLRCRCGRPSASRTSPSRTL